MNKIQKVDSVWHMDMRKNAKTLKIKTPQYIKLHDNLWLEVLKNIKKRGGREIVFKIKV